MPSDKENEERNIMFNDVNSDSASMNSVQSSGLMNSPIERKELLRTYLTRTHSLREYCRGSMITLDEIGQEIDVINFEVPVDDKVSCQDEVLMDSQIITTSSHVLRKASTVLTKELDPYDLWDFVDKLKKYVFKLPDSSLEKPNWSLFALEVTNWFRRTPNFSALSGCLIPLEKKVVVKRRSKNRDSLAPTSRPEAIINVEKTDDRLEETLEKFKLMTLNYIQETGKPIEFFHLVLDPDYGKTIENMLHVAFLVRDRIIKIAADESGNPVIMRCSKEMRTAAKKNKTFNIQNVLSLSYKQWETLLKIYRIEHAMIDFT
ncbi:non-structural maintenance of chromosomes element 4 homolog A [Venturia canescens]|uniref:non-structural maintenance of chromosomes element 4 homolog A n=1 Tax=Venturia canescens TaxID=32260 RepID=UPI001C9BEB63|nr:non-structural maintenance of chromosomes element 4 homolog A-like [Venturia canescens]